MINENEIYLKKVLNSEEYLNNKMQIDTIKQTLVQHSDVPEKLIDWLIDAVEKNATLVAEAKFKYENKSK